MHNATVLDLADCTEFRQSLQARPPRIVHGTALLLALLLGAALLWGALTEADLVVRVAILGVAKQHPADANHDVGEEAHVASSRVFVRRNALTASDALSHASVSMPSWRRPAGVSR